VTSLNISKGGIPKRPVHAVAIHGGGLEGDGHNHVKHYRPEQAVSLQDMEILENLHQEGYALSAGMTGENINVRGVHVNALPIGTRLIFENGVQIEVTRKRPPCYVLDAIDPRLKKAIVGRCGVYAKVLQPGLVSVGETITKKISRMPESRAGEYVTDAVC
ncbi:MAG: MOSC domain-containing protein, partial [Candidatus Omnitrophica bacterium]|nr:MOSC domain-containing protein [Candidatus Omnitrophota bacterium]